MLASQAGGLAALLGALGLSPALTKPFPHLIDALDPLLSPLSGVLDPLASVLSPVGSIVSPVTDALSPVAGVLGPLIDPLLAPLDPVAGVLAPLLAPLSGILGGGDDAQSSNAAFLPAEFNVLQATQTSSSISPPRNTCAIPVYNISVPSAPKFDPFDPVLATFYRYREQKSVNLGAWFVLEKWMVPSMFTCAAGDQGAEIDVASGWGSTEGARQLLEYHWDTFIKEDDFQYLASIGINTVRLPIGYWSLGPEFCQGTPFEEHSSVYQGSWPRVLRAIDWAGKHGVGVLVDLHGAPGSQNGQQHSGISDGKINLFNNATNIAKTVDALKFLTSNLAQISNCVGIELLNEPENDPSLPEFYNSAITQLRAVSKFAETFPLYIHDAFALTQYSDFLNNRTDFVILDHHSYFVFTSHDSVESATEHVEEVDSEVLSSLQKASSELNRNIVVDEWSCSLSPESLSQEKDADVAQSNFCKSQMDVYSNATAGWGFWSYQKEDCSNDQGWCFKSAVGKFLPSNFFSYPESSLDLSTHFVNVTLPSHDQFIAEVFLTSPRRSLEYSISYEILRHRWDAIYVRRSSGNDANTTIDSLYAAPVSQAKSESNLSILQSVVSKGYSDGFVTAQRFAAQNRSKLGFVGQYIRDSMASLGSTVIPVGNEEYYRQWFWQGLKDGEDSLGNALKATT